MRKIGLLLAVPLVFLLLAGCVSQPGPEVGLDKPFSLGLGESVSITGEDLAVRFIEVINDSRCPQGAVCVWAGEVSARLEITYQGVLDEKIMVQPGRSQPARADFADYAIAFDVEPYPQLGEEINREDYRLNLTFSRKPALAGGILATFNVLDEVYSIFITSEEVIEQVLALERGESMASIPNGRLVRGAVAYNQPWSWHIDPEDIQMVELTIEVCDGTPSMVEADLDYWIDTVQRFCPWSAKLVAVEDFR